MPTRNVALTLHHETLIDSLVSSGRYQNASEVLRDGLRLVEAREAREATKLQAAARAGFADLDEGRYQDILEDALDVTIATLGRQAGARVRAAGA